jgi:thiamine biosynthesis protein ThiS
MIKIFVYINGEKFFLNKKISLQNLLKFLDLNTKGIVIEHEKVLVEKEFYSKTFLINSTSLEILSLVGGG